MTNVGPINAHETLDTFRGLAETYDLSRHIHGLGKVGLEAYRTAISDVVPLYFSDEAGQIIQDMHYPNCVMVERNTTPQAVVVRAAVLSETTSMVASFAIGLRYGRLDQSKMTRLQPQSLSVELSYVNGLSSYAFIADWRPPFALPDTNTIDPEVGIAVSSKYNRGFGAVLDAVRQFNIVLTPVADEA